MLSVEIMVSHSSPQLLHVDVLGPSVVGAPIICSSGGVCRILLSPH